MTKPITLPTPPGQAAKQTGNGKVTPGHEKQQQRNQTGTTTPAPTTPPPQDTVVISPEADSAYRNQNPTTPTAPATPATPTPTQDPAPEVTPTTPPVDTYVPTQPSQPTAPPKTPQGNVTPPQNPVEEPIEEATPPAEQPPVAPVIPYDFQKAAAAYNAVKRMLSKPEPVSGPTFDFNSYKMKTQQALVTQTVVNATFQTGTTDVSQVKKPEETREQAHTTAAQPNTATEAATSKPAESVKETVEPLKQKQETVASEQSLVKQATNEKTNEQQTTSAVLKATEIEPSQKELAATTDSAVTTASDTATESLEEAV